MVAIEVGKCLAVRDERAECVSCTLDLLAVIIFVISLKQEVPLSPLVFDDVALGIG